MIEYKNILDVGEAVQEKVRQWRNSPRVRRGMLDRSEISVEQHRAWLSSLAAKAEINKVRIAFQDGSPFGLLNLRGVERESDTCDWGFYVGEDAFLGRKLGQRLIYDGQEWGFIEENIRKMYATVRSDNLRVLHNDMTSGCHIEGFLKDHLRDANGELVGIYLIAQFRDEWPRNREKIAAWGKIGD